MKTIVFICSTVLFLMCATEEVSKTSGKSAMLNVGKQSSLKCGDEDPIIVRGHVNNVSGSPISGALVRLKKNGVVQYSATTNSQGDYLMSGVQSSTYLMLIGATGYVTKSFDIGVTSEIN